MADNELLALFKYKDISGCGICHVVDMLRNNEVWFASPLSFNDPFDCQPYLVYEYTRDEVVLRQTAYLSGKENHLRDALEDAEQIIPQDQGEFEQFVRQKSDQQNRSVENTGILCLTTQPNNQLMWTHYAKWHTGVCIQFRVDVEGIDGERHVDFIGSAFQVEYSRHRPKVNFVRDSKYEIARKYFLTKTLPYNYEEEWRMLRFDQGPGLQMIPKGIIGAVILGCRIDPDARECIVNACAEYDGDVQIVHAILDKETYSLRFVQERIV